MSRRQALSDQEFVRAVIVNWLEIEDETLGDAHDHMIGPEEVRVRAEQYNRMIDIANDTWLELDIDRKPYTDEEIDELVDGAADDLDD